jgi:putative FmdB family regulatory protein
MMPTYDYICDACTHEFEAFELITSQPQTECPICKVPRLRRKIGPGAAILFKGSGFYQTDYRSESYKKAAKAEKSSSEGTAASKSDGAGKGDSSKASTGTSAPASSPPTSSASSSGSTNGTV